MNKLTIVAFALIVAVLGGCVSAGDMIGTNAATKDANSPFPHEPEIHAGG